MLDQFSGASPVFKSFNSNGLPGNFTGERRVQDETIKTKEISNEFFILEKQIERLSLNVEKLEEKLCGMINSQNACETDGASTPEKPLCEMANSIRGRRYDVEAINGKIQRLVNSIEL